MGRKARQATSASVPAETVSLAQPVRIGIATTSGMTRVRRFANGVIVLRLLFEDRFRPSRLPLPPRPEDRDEIGKQGEKFQPRSQRHQAAGSAGFALSTASHQAKAPMDTRPDSAAWKSSPSATP